ncbi:YfhO family protein [Aridibaculum aurantiacum]|uniref:YfhO family protein n=1 Tax=Aridibaculum aurantiacum TaxID=2810307 RepID=UPI001A965995|nr:YfhO family protein [Aridibaculum aurantiacum]
MKNIDWKKLIPHAIAIVVFLVVAVIYCKPALEGKVLSQHDISHWKGAFQQSENYKEVHGHYPLWTNSLFSGMPTFQIGGVSGNDASGYFHAIITLGLPAPIQFFFLACICFYFLCIVLRINPYVGILGSLAFAYATYNPIIVAVGHNTKMLSIAYMPAVLGSVILIFQRKYLLGAAFTALFASTLIAMNHLQIAYYLFIAMGIMTIFFMIDWVKNKDWKHIGLVAASSIGAGIIALLCNAVSLFSTYEYQKATIRGGSSQLASAETENSKTGLTKDYAFSYSMYPSEAFVMLIPRMYGGSSDKLEVQQEKSKAIEALQSMPQELSQQLQGGLSFYWGGIGGTSGPPYVGAIICFLAIIAMFVLDRQHKWWALTAILLTIMMSWGSYFDSFNNILYQYLPYYNKFRAPSMILVIPQLLLPMLAVLAVNHFINVKEPKALMPQFKKGLIATGALFVVIFILYFSLDFTSISNAAMLKQVQQMNQPQVLDYLRSFLEGMREDRRSLMMGDIFRSLGFIAAAAVILFLLIRKTVSPLIAAWALIAFALIDVMVINTKYLNAENYQEQEENMTAFVKTAADNAILADTSYFRVFNYAGDAFNENYTSYYYNSVGGYHPAKLIIYQDLIEKKLSAQQPNMNVFNMLNTKYFIQKDRNGQTTNYQPNPTALGPVWFVPAIRFVKDAKEEMDLLGQVDPKDTALVQEEFKSSIPFTPVADSAAMIQLVKNDNDVVTYRSNAATNQFAVFSEIYYKEGWKAFVDGKETPIVKVNYVLRGLPLPAGQHNIEFRFEPAAYYTGKTVTTIFSILMILLVAGALFMEWRNGQRKVA